MIPNIQGVKAMKSSNSLVPALKLRVLLNDLSRCAVTILHGGGLNTERSLKQSQLQEKFTC